jgi:DNA-binding LytR/AlgR family response regulator
MKTMFNIVICDDDIKFANNLNKKISDIVLKNGCDCNITELYNGKALIEYCETNSVDIIFTDIDMPESKDLNVADITHTEGFTAAQQLQVQYENIEIVFVSAHEELAYQAFSYRPFSFVSKRDLQRLDEDLGELINKLKRRKCSNILFHMNIGKKTYAINVDEIMYFKIEKHYIRAYTVNGEVMSCRCSIKDAYERLAKADFIYIHRSYLVNCRYIKYFDTQVVIMLNDEEISVTRDEKKLKEAQVIFNRYKRRLR